MEQKINIVENLTKAIAFRHPDAKAYLKSNLALSSVKSIENMLLEAVKKDITFIEEEVLFTKISQIEFNKKVPKELSSLVVNVYEYVNEIGIEKMDLGE